MSASSTGNRILLWEKLTEIRPGRDLLFYRREDLSSSSSSSCGSSGGTCFNVVFLHGTCATLTQYGGVLDSLAWMLSREEEEAKVTLKCHLYDSLGCGQSPVSLRWQDYHADEAVRDLNAVLQNHVDRSLDTIVVAHSHAPNVVLRCLHQATTSTASGKLVSGCLFLCPAMDGSPKAVGDGGHAIFRLPVFVLKCLQKSMTESFLKMAYHPETDLSQLPQNVRASNDGNDMRAVQAIHRNLQWATQEEGRALVQQAILTMVLHGEADGVLPLECGQHVADVVGAREFRVVQKASHQVMEEQPDQVAKALLQLVRRLATPE